MQGSKTQDEEAAYSSFIFNLVKMDLNLQRCIQIMVKYKDF